MLDNADFIKKSAGISVIKFNKTLIGGFIQRVVGECVIKIPLDGLVDVEKEKTKAEKEIVNLEKFIAGSTARLSNKDFVSKAPAEVISQQKETLERKQAELAELKKHLASL